MATYYKWNRYSIKKEKKTERLNSDTNVGLHSRYEYLVEASGLRIVNTTMLQGTIVDCRTLTNNYSASGYSSPSVGWKDAGGTIEASTFYQNATYFFKSNDIMVKSGASKVYVGDGKGSFVSNVYSTSSSQYPTNGVSNGYYYDSRTTVTSPTNPTELNYSNQITTQLVSLTWNASTSNTNYPVKSYEVSYSLNNGNSWTVAGTTEETSYEFGLPSPYINQIKFRIRAKDSNSQFSDYIVGENSTVKVTDVDLPVIVLPDNAKLGETITISWNSVQDATNYILQRKVDDGEWTQIYSGANLSTTNLVDNLGISYRIAFNVGSNFTSKWSQEYRLNTYEKLIEMTYLGDDGNYMPLYPRTISNAVVNASDLINTVSLSGTYQGTGIESNTVLLNIKKGIEPKIAFVSNTEGNVEIVNNFDDNGNLVVDNNSNVAGEEYSYVVIGKKED